MAQMVLHCGAEKATFEDLKLVVQPDQHPVIKNQISDRYGVMPHHQLVGAVRGLLKEFVHPNVIQNETFALAGTKSYPGARMFGMMQLNLDVSAHEVEDVACEIAQNAPEQPQDLDDLGGLDEQEILERAVEAQEDHRGVVPAGPAGWDITTVEADKITPVVAFRNSYDLSMAISFGLGYNVFICDNLALTSDILYSRKHLGKNLMRDIMGMVGNLVGTVVEQYNFDLECREAMRRFEISQESGYELLGIMAGQEILSLENGTKSVLAEALNQWKNPSHEIFQDRNLWSLNNAITYAHRRVGIRNRMEVGHNAHDFFLGQLGPQYLQKAVEIRNYRN